MKDFLAELEWEREKNTCIGIEKWWLLARKRRGPQKSAEVMQMESYAAEKRILNSRGWGVKPYCNGNENRLMPFLISILSLQCQESVATGNLRISFSFPAADPSFIEICARNWSMGRDRTRNFVTFLKLKGCEEKEKVALKSFWIWLGSVGTFSEMNFWCLRNLIFTICFYLFEKIVSFISCYLEIIMVVLLDQNSSRIFLRIIWLSNCCFKITFF